MNWGQGRWGQTRWGQGWWGRGSGRKLKWAPIVSDRSCGSVDPQSFEEDEFPAPELQCAPPPESLGEHDFSDAAVADRVALTIGDAVSIASGEPVAAARMLVSRARDRRDLYSRRHLAIARPLTRNYPQLRSLMLKMRAIRSCGS